MLHAYLFEARGIQRFLFSSGKLRDILGGSELLDYLCAEDGLLDCPDITPATFALKPCLITCSGC
tara:strand:- start:7394 stop:7588 length:195 start_codon:yes stop_codon:yes gene_type:complete